MHDGVLGRQGTERSRLLRGLRMVPDYFSPAAVYNRYDTADAKS